MTSPPEPQYVDADAAGLELKICIADGRPLLLLPMSIAVACGQLSEGGELFRWSFRDVLDPDDDNPPVPQVRYARLIVEELFPEGADRTPDYWAVPPAPPGSGRRVLRFERIEEPTPDDKA